MDKTIIDQGQLLCIFQGLFWRCAFKGIVHPKMNILSFIHPSLVPNLYDFLPSV